MTKEQFIEQFNKLETLKPETDPERLYQCLNWPVTRLTTFTAYDETEKKRVIVSANTKKLTHEKFLEDCEWYMPDSIEYVNFDRDKVPYKFTRKNDLNNSHDFEITYIWGICH